MTSGGEKSTAKVQPAATALQYKNKRPRKSSNKRFFTTVFAFAVVCGVALAFSSSEGKGDAIDDLDECKFKLDNCSTTERCENTVGTFVCIECPQYHVPTANGLECSLGECPLDFSPSENGKTCISECRPNYMETLDGLRCKADICGPSGQLAAEQKVNSNNEGGLRHDILPGDRFGAAVAPMGDVDGNGVNDFVVGASQNDPTDFPEVGRTLPVVPVLQRRGYVIFIFLNADHTVLSNSMIGTSGNGKDTVGGLASPMHPGDYFGASLTCLGDLDGDGVPDLIVGAPGDDDGGKDRGALYVLFMLATGSVKSQQKISSTQGELRVYLLLWDNGRFGSDVSVVGGVDKENGTVDLVVATYLSKTVHFMQLNLDGTVRRAYILWQAKAEDMSKADTFNRARSIADAGDVDGNGVVDIVVGTPAYNTRGDGGFVVLLMASSSSSSSGGGVLRAAQTTSSMLGFTGTFQKMRVGGSVTGLGDLDGDGTPDLAIGAVDATRGRVFVVLLHPDGSVKGKSTISHTEGGLVGPLHFGDFFGSSMATLVERGDSEEDVVTLLVGASRDRAMGDDGGGLYILKVPPGFVELCPGEDEKCINSGDDGYTCG